VVPDLVAGIAHAPGKVGPRLGDPARDEEGRPQPDAVQQSGCAGRRPAARIAGGDDVEIVGNLWVVGQHR